MITPAPWDVQDGTDYSARSQPLAPVPSAHRFAMAGWHVWCGSIVANPGGGFSLFFSAWPEAEGHEGWVTHSEIWRATAPEPFGPFQNPEPVLSASDSGVWDADNFHNVTVRHFEGRYFLYYTGNRGNGDWWVHRNNQRIGVAVADSPSGPWRRRAEPLIDVSPDSWDSLCIANPAVAPAASGGYMMIYKGVTSGDLPFGTRVLHGLAFADMPDGPFTKSHQPLFDVPGVRFPFEDPHIWRGADGRFRCLMKDMFGLEGSAPRATLLFESENGVDWDFQKFGLIATPHLLLEDGAVLTVDRLERPAYFDHPEMGCLSFAVKPLGDEPSFLVLVPRVLE